MSRTAKKTIEHEAQPQLLVDSKRDTNPYWKSTLFSDVYLKNDVPREYKSIWEDDEYGPFYEFYQGFINLCHETDHEAFEKWREADTVKNWIVHVMDLLGWENNSERRQNSYLDNETFSNKENGRTQTYRPDLVYFDKPTHKAYTQKEKDNDKKLLEVRSSRTGAKIIVEAKYWDRLSSISDSKKEAKQNDSASSLGPELQTLKYMDLFQHDFGILTDGKTWKLFHRELSQGIDNRSFDFDLGNLRELALDLDSHGNEERFRHFAKYFYYFFAKQSLVHSSDNKTVPFVYEIFDYSKKYALSIEDDLKKRFIVSMGVTCNALKESCELEQENLDLEMIRNVSESHLFNILFVKSCEVRRILPITSTQYLRLSLHEVIETLDAMSFDPDKDWDDYLRDFKYTFGKKFDWDGFEIFNRFINLYEIIHDGTAKSKDFGFEIEGFKESVFKKDEWRFAKKHKINNRNMVKILFDLNFIESSFKGRKFQQIPYSYFTSRQLGSIYESFLEYRLEEAETDMVFNKGKWSKANLKSKKVKSLKLVDNHVVKKGDLFFSPDNKDRKMTGSFYTPDYLVKYIVKDALGPLCENKTSDEILGLSICDPAMGSGHFLGGALEFLTDKYREAKSEEIMDDVVESYAESARRVLNSCIHGVDINKRAVKLAKMSLWLTTAYKGNKLGKLDQQLINGNSLIGLDFSKSFKEIFSSQGGFSAIVGNPPWLMAGYHYHDIMDDLKARYESATGKFDLYYLFIEKSLDLISDEGRVGLIVPNKFFQTKSGGKIRDVIVRSEKLVEIVDFKLAQLFKGATNYSCILQFAKKETENVLYKYCSEDLDLIDSIEIELKPGAKESWVFESSYWMDVFNKMESTSVSLKEITKRFGGGIQTGADKIYHLQDLKLKDKFVRPILLGKDVRRYKKAEAKKQTVFPYKVVDDDYSIVSNTEFSKSKMFKHLSSEKDKLEGRVWFGKTAKELSGEWYGLMFVDKPFVFEEKAILTPYLSSGSNFTISENMLFGTGAVVGITLREDLDESIYYILGLLNSCWVNKYIKAKTPEFSGGYHKFNSVYLKQIPIRLINFEQKSEVAIYKKIVEKVKKILKLNGDPDKIKKLSDEIDYEISRLYGVEFENISSSAEAA